MTSDPPLRWRADGCEEALLAAEALRAAAGGGAGAPLPRGWTVVKDRSMRLVARGRVPGPSGPIEAFAKVRRTTSALDRAKAALRFPRSVAEGALLLELALLGVAVPRVLGWSVAPERDVEVLLLEAVGHSVDLAAWAREPRSHAEVDAVADGVARLLRTAHDAGWADRDLHRGNVLWTPRGAVLLDPGTQPLREGPLSAAARTAALGLAAHGLAPDVRTGLRALRAYFGGDRAEARRHLPGVLRAARRRTRAWRRARARRATRSGRHFEVVRDPRGRFTCVRALPHAPSAWIDLVPALLGTPPADARALKADGRVFAVALPGRAADAVVKRFESAWRERFRTPRALRAFRRAYALRVRGVGCPEPLLAAAAPSGTGVCISALAGPPGGDPLDLWRSVLGVGDGPSRFQRLSAPARRDALERLGRFLRRLHDADVAHRDLKAANLVAWPTVRGPGFAVVDLEGARLRDRPVPWTRRARDLGRLDASLGSPVSRADRRRVLRGYFHAFTRPGLPIAAFARLVARASARKRGPGGAPR